jgi:hypothetical protein
MSKKLFIAAFITAVTLGLVSNNLFANPNRNSAVEDPERIKTRVEAQVKNYQEQYGLDESQTKKLTQEMLEIEKKQIEARRVISELSTKRQEALENITTKEQKEQFELKRNSRREQLREKARISDDSKMPPNRKAMPTNNEDHIIIEVPDRQVLELEPQKP